MAKAQIGLIGLAAMGQNLARNIANHKFRISVFNRTTEKTEKFLKKFGNEYLSGEKELKDFVESLEKPRKIILMVKAGDPVDTFIEQLRIFIDPEDIIIDGGNSHYLDTERRQKETNLIGMGISGGEEGALNGPSIMPGGEKKAYDQISKILEAIAADDGIGGKCVTHIGPGGSGHFVKTVHNGIEYGIMQSIAEAYDILRKVGGLSNQEMAETFAEWSDSFLLEISAKILARDDNLIDKIKDCAQQKGTGKWTTEAAFDLGVSVPTINAAVDARIISGAEENRKSGGNMPKKLLPASSRGEIKPLIKNALKLSTICCYFQGFDLLQKTGTEKGWNLDLGEIARIWRGGCIIRSELLDKFQQAFDKNETKAKEAKLEIIKSFEGKVQENWREAVSLASLNGIPVPAISASLSYYDSILAEKLPQNLTQAMRDFFGAHTYERTDKEGHFHTMWTKI